MTEVDRVAPEKELRRLAEAVVKQVHGEPWGSDFSGKEQGVNISGLIHSHSKEGTDALVALRSYLAVNP